MCGIAGIVSFDRDPAGVSRARLASMAGPLGHRGPDGTGFFVDTERHEVGLAHTRLSIIDLAGGWQPMSNEDGSIQVVFNGEIFNYVELREELRALGHVFATQSDTEVIAHLYEEMGDAFVQRLNGQFAIALWDSRRRRTVLVRDRAGILPLFYRVDRLELLFASEIKAILPALKQRPGVNPAALRQLMGLWSPLSPETMFEGIHEVEPGQMLVIEGGQVAKHHYWQWRLARPGEYRSGSEDALAEELLSLLEDATRIRLRSDVPVGAYLSGGLDSSVLTGLISRTANTRLRTFSIGFEDQDLDESAYQKRMIDFIGAEHSHVTCSRRDVAERFYAAVASAEAPLTRTAPVPMGMLSGHVRASGFTVVLTGEGADEVFGGYDLFKEAKIRAFCARHPDSRLRPLLLKRLYPYLDFTRNQSTEILKTYFGAVDSDPDDPLFTHRSRWSAGDWCANFLSGAFQERIRQSGQGTDADVLERLGAQLEGLDVFGRGQLLEARTLMAGYLLSAQGDRMLMSNSVEGRFPFLDHRVIEFGNSLDPRLKMKALREKYLLKKAARNHVPPAILNRTKQPYRAPDAVSFMGANRPEYVTELLSPSALKDYGYFDPDKVTRLTRKLDDAARNGRPISHRDSLVWLTALSTQIWHRIFQETV